MQFNRSEIIVPQGNRYPDGALVVDGYDGVGRLLAHPVGGGLQFIIGAEQLAQLRRVAAEERRNPRLRRAQFGMDGVHGRFHGWTAGESWNGWAKPMFELQEARRVISAMPELKGQYDASDDRCITLSQDGEEEAWNAELIQPDGGGTVKVYPVGAGCWCWDEIPNN
ncbi:MAG: hypothetical protein RIS76_1056 [Verrucomicrobiota bacterium]|jgi:hypothetical protein